MDWVRFFPAKWIAGTSSLTVTETGVYIRLVAQMYVLEEPLDEDIPLFAAMCKMRKKAFEKVYFSLLEKQKLHKIHEKTCVKNVFSCNCVSKIIGNHVEQEFNHTTRVRENAQKNGQQGGRPKEDQSVTKPGRITDPETQLGNPKERKKERKKDYPLTPFSKDVAPVALAPALAGELPAAAARAAPSADEKPATSPEHRAQLREAIDCLRKMPLQDRPRREPKPAPFSLADKP